MARARKQPPTARPASDNARIIRCQRRQANAAKQMKPKTQATRMRRPAAGSAKTMKVVKRPAAAAAAPRSLPAPLQRTDSLGHLVLPGRKGKTKATGDLMVVSVLPDPNQGGNPLALIKLQYYSLQPLDKESGKCVWVPEGVPAGSVLKVRKPCEKVRKQCHAYAQCTTIALKL